MTFSLGVETPGKPPNGVLSATALHDHGGGGILSCAFLGVGPNELFDAIRLAFDGTAGAASS